MKKLIADNYIEWLVLLAGAIAWIIVLTMGAK